MTEPQPIIDAHQHFWDLSRNYHPWLCDAPPIPFRYGDYGAIRRSYLPDDYFRDAAGQNLVGSVHVEAEWDPADPVGETRWLHGVADRFGYPHGIVAQAWFARDDIGRVLAGQAAFPLVRGVRQKPPAAASPDAVVIGAPGSMDDPTWRAGYALLAKHGLAYDIQTPWWHLPEAARLARDFPDTQMILNHTGLPADRSKTGLTGWGEAMRALAGQPNVALKISGLGLPGRPWTIESNGPIVRQAIEIFGVGRVMFASNFPVDGLTADYDTIFDGFKQIVADFDPAERRKMFYDNAVRYYRLQL